MGAGVVDGIQTVGGVEDGDGSHARRGHRDDFAHGQCHEFAHGEGRGAGVGHNWGIVIENHSIPPKASGRKDKLWSGCCAMRDDLQGVQHNALRCCPTVSSIRV